MESLSDHCLITFNIKTGWTRPPPNKAILRKWNPKKFDSDLFEASLYWRAGNPNIEDPMNISQVVRWLDASMEEACDVAAPRIGPRRPRRRAYWWCESVADLRRQCIGARRSWQRAKRRRRPEDQIAELGVCYKHLRKDLRLEIGRRKSAAWQELLGSVDRDPWGLPYRMVLKKLRTASLGLTEVLDPEVLSELLKSLFPCNLEPDPIDDWSDFVWDDVWSTSPTEINEAVKKATSS